MKPYSVISDLCLYENVFCNDRIRFHTNSDHLLQNTFSHKHRPLITEYVFIQTQITHYRIRFHTNTDHSLQNTYSVMSDLSLYENVFCNE
jgi:hypothetical protein